MKKLHTTLLLICFYVTVQAQSIKVTISSGLSDANVRQRIEYNMAALLNEVNEASAQERPLRLDGINISAGGRRSLERLWENLHFMCEDNDIVERCITSSEGYVVRNIYIRVNPMVADYDEESERALTIRLTRDGQIASVVMAASDQLYDKLVRHGVDVLDFARRQTILGFVENYRSHYDEKDLNALRQVFSDDALIVTGTVVMKRDYKGDRPHLRPDVIYKEQNKTQYLNSLRDVFRSNKYIKVTFSDIEVMRHPSNPDYYGVTLRQRWQSGKKSHEDGYHDDGWVFLLWEFREGQDPVIHVRTWQEDKIITMANGEVINIHDFEIPKK